MKRSCLAVMIMVMVLLPSPAGAQTAEEWYQKGFKHSLQGQSRQAIQAYRNALELSPDWAEAHHALGTLLFRSGEGPQAIAHFRMAERYYAGRDDAQAITNLGIVRQNLKLAYQELGLEPRDFEQIETVPGLPANVQWRRAGGGFLAGKSGTVLTTYHGVKDAREIRVRLADQSLHPAKLVRSFIIYDVAVLELQPATPISFAPLPLGDASLMERGDPVFAFNIFGKDSKPTLSQEGNVLAVNALESNQDIFHVGLSVEPNESGGPLFNEKGEVVGMLFAREDIQKIFRRMKPVPANTSFAVKSTYLQRVVDNATSIGSRKAPGSKGRSLPKASTGNLWRGWVLIEVSP